jgi:hypothetical protein
MGVGGQRHAPTDLTPEKSPDIHCTGGWLGPSAGLHVGGEEKNLLPPPGFETRTV